MPWQHHQCRNPAAPGPWVSYWAMSPRSSRRAHPRCWAWASAPAVSSIPGKASSATRCRSRSANPWISPSRWRPTCPCLLHRERCQLLRLGRTGLQPQRGAAEFPLRPGGVPDRASTSVGSQGGLGVGFGVVLGGKVYSGIHGNAGEFRSAFCQGPGDLQFSLTRRN